MSKLFIDLWNSSGPKPQDAALIFAGSAVSWRDLCDMVNHSRQQLRRFERKRLALRFVPAAGSYALLLASQSLGLDLFLFDGTLDEQRCLELARELRLRAMVFPDCSPSSCSFEFRELSESQEWSGGSTVTILTSGSTGKPKAVRHTWESLLRPVRRNGESAPRWLQTYRPHLYAGIQVLFQCLAEYGTLAVPSPNWGPQEVAGFVADSRVQYISATPSYWRRLLLFSGRQVLDRIHLRQITVGGEVVDQCILDSLRVSFRSARLVHIYATTELGRCFSVSDGLAGFPRIFLDAPLPGDAWLKIQDGELFAKSANAMLGYDSGSPSGSQTSEWFATGDLVSVSGDRVSFSGRKTEMINVGGNKVHPLDVERVVRGVPGVADVRVYGRASSISGQLVSCEVVSAPACDDETVKRAVQKMCLQSLAPYQRPRLITMVSAIQLSSSHKTVRGVCP